MEPLSDQLKVVLADTFALYLKAQYFHWNVEGPNFPQYHDFLGKFYGEVYGAVDGLAELIRTLDQYAPGSFSRFSELTNIQDQRSIPTAEAMLEELMVDNLKVLSTLYNAYDQAESERQFGISNFLQDRITAHEKHKWMLRAITKR